MNFDTTIKNMQKGALGFEVALNIAGSLPIISLATSPLRCSFGVCQAMAGIGLLITGTLTGVIFNSNISQNSRSIVKAGSVMTMHGSLNIIRSLAEAILGTSIIGSLSLFAYNWKKYKFLPIGWADNWNKHPDFWVYGSEQLAHDVYSTFSKK